VAGRDADCASAAGVAGPLRSVVLGALSELEHWLAGYRDLGRADLSLDALEARRDAFLAGALARAG
jgi:hypothetical protein